MITITERECTEEELQKKREHIELHRSGSRFFEMQPIFVILLWCLAGFVFTFLLIPIGMFMKSFNLTEHPKVLMITGNPLLLMLLGVCCITLISIPLIWRYKKKLVKENKEYVSNQSRDLEVQKIEVKTISHIVEVWEIYHLEDFGPGFLMRTKENEYFSLITQELIYCWPEDEEEFESDIIPSEIVFERWVGSNTTKDFYLNGEGIPKSGYIHLEHLIDVNNEDLLSDFFTTELNQFPDSIIETVKAHASKDLVD